MPSTVTDYTGQCQTLLPVKDTNLKSYATSKSDTNNPIRLGAGTWQACWAAGRAGCRPGWLLAVWEHRRCSSWVLSVSYILPVDPVYNIININYASSRHGRRPDVVRACMFTMQYVDCERCIGYVDFDTQAFPRIVLPTHKLFVHVGLD